MQLNGKKLTWGIATTLFLTGCIDSRYDLSNVDTTSEFKVKDLTIPINLETVELSDIIKVEEGDQIKEITINGNTFYAIEESGDFLSDDLEIDQFEIDPNHLEDETLDFIDSNLDSDDLLELLGGLENELEYNGIDIDEMLQDITDITFEETSIEMEISTDELADNVESSLQDLELTFPKGLNVVDISAGDLDIDVAAYNPLTGVVKIDKVPFRQNKMKIKLTANGLDLSSYKNYFTPNADGDNRGSISIKSMLNIDNCKLEIEGDKVSTRQSKNIKYNVRYQIGKLRPTSVMGRVEYDFTGSGLNINPISLENVPDFLNDPETNLILSNPQIYLRLKNPVGKYGLYYQSALDIVAEREGEIEQFTSPVVKVPAEDGYFNFVLAADVNSIYNIPEKFADNLERATYNRLDEVVANNNGTGLPKSLDIRLIDSRIPDQMLKSPFEVNKGVEGMEGSYMFIAPLSLKGRKVVDGQIVEEGSQIVKTVSGWWSEDLADLNIEYLKIGADATNELPTGVILNMYAIDRDGKQISTEGSLQLTENAVGAPIEITLRGLEDKPFNNLDGIRLYVIAMENEGEPLAPSQSITLDNIRAKVTGSYIREL